jgi:large subunit ribosomal protein L29
MKVNDLKKLTVNDLLLKESESTKELFNLNFQLHTGRLENTSKIKIIRKDIARIKTVLTECSQEEF